MNELLYGAWLVARKDLRIELRTGEVTMTTALFAFLTVVIASLSLYLDRNQAASVAPGVLWISITFAGVLAMGRSWARERENDALRGLLLSPLPRASIYLGKTLSSFVFLVAVEVLVLPVVTLFFHLDLSETWPAIVAFLLLGTLGFVAAGSLFSALTVKSRARDLLLSVVLFPLVSPALLSSVVATRDILGGAELETAIGWVELLVAFDLTFLAAGLLLFEPLTSD
ncbi:MAG: heme exporter protein CcmB [Polyangiaceae bacterium]|nr:heme exporter protein CcmB [Polyangiaceae bacterium]